MENPPSILCPVDFSAASAGALRYASAIAGHFGARVVVLTVEDALLTEAVGLATGTSWSPEDSRRALERFVEKTLEGGSVVPASLEYVVAVGKPSVEILRVARTSRCDLLVISTHGLTGMRKLFFGSTTERVLRETTAPVLVTPPVDPGRLSVDDAHRLIGRILVPVDLSDASAHQLVIASGAARAISAPLIVAHVIEPLKGPLAARLHSSRIEADRRGIVETRLEELLQVVPPDMSREALLAYGDPAEELAKVAHDRKVGLVVMGLHGSPLLGPRMGSVTYRLLCLVPTLVLAIPPRPSSASGDTVSEILAADHHQ
jgi:nucleotide-binding universal stress UspA family protein